MTFVLLESILAWGEWSSQDGILGIFEIEDDFVKILAAEGDTADRTGLRFGWWGWRSYRLWWYCWWGGWLFRGLCVLGVFGESMGIELFSWVCFSWTNTNFRNKVVASCASRRIKRTPSWRSQNERPVKTGARMVLLGHTRHYFVFNILARRAAATAPRSDVCSDTDQRGIILGHTRHYFVSGQQ